MANRLGITSPQKYEKGIVVTIHKIAIANDLKTYVTSSRLEELVFSYGLSCSWTTSTVNLVLQQKETDFTFSMALEEEDDHLLVKNFTLNDNKRLESWSASLYDAAIVEIFLQALDLLFFFAACQDVNTSFFVLEKDDSDNLTSFDGIFISISSQKKMGNGQVTLTLPTTLSAYDKFVDQAESIKAKIQQQLWQEQRDDNYLRRYLQSHQKGESLWLKDLMAQEERPFSSMGQVIVFPKLDNSF